MSLPNQDPDVANQTSTDGQSAPLEGNQPPLNDSQSIDWQAKYQGLQRAFQKAKDAADATIKKLQEQLAEATAQLESALQDASAKEQQQAALATVKSQLEQQLQQAQKEREELSIKLNRQNLLLNEYPDLAPLADFIPPADTDDAFKANADSFRNAIKAYVEKEVKVTLSGASPAPSSQDTQMTTTTEIERLWRVVYATAGVPGREKEYAEANNKLQELLANN